MTGKKRLLYYLQRFIGAFHNAVVQRRQKIRYAIRIATAPGLIDPAEQLDRCFLSLLLSFEVKERRVKWGLKEQNFFPNLPF